MVDKVLAESCHQAQGFHIGPERMVVLRWKEGHAGIITVLFDQHEGFRQQLDAPEVVGLLPPVLQPEIVFFIREEVLPSDTYHISIGCAGVAGEEEEVPGDDMDRFIEATRDLKLIL